MVLTELLVGLRRGRHVYLDGPYGRFTLPGPPGKGFVFVAGGIGITPMLSMLRNLGIPAHRIHTELFDVS
ncbi:MAG TPA: hypothetical protein VE074_13420 [Jatrophihabitantaceae bacterium]|nr:hypothetical protein [Jatrophihabitantaceae bacterium]